MSDFLADLEAELRSAAHRRAARRRPRVPVALRRAVPALVVLAIAVAAVAWLAAPAPDDDVAVTGESVHTATTTLREAVPPAGCAGEPERQMTATPPALLELLGVLRRPQTEPDALPAADGGWVPLGAWAPKGVRWPGRDRFATELHLVPGVGPIPGERAGCDAEKPTRPPAVCLIVGPAGAGRVACFADGEIANGAAATLIDGTVYGVVPDGVEEVTLEAGGTTVRADVVENVYEAELPGARAGMEMTVRSVVGRQCGAGPDPTLLGALAALRRPPDPGASVPADVLGAVQGRPAEPLARIAGGGDGITYWLVPLREGDVPCAPADRVCVVPERDGQAVGAPICSDATELMRHGVFLAGPLGDRVVVYGLARAGIERVSVDIDNEPAGGVDVVDGVAAGLLPDRVRWRDKADVRFVFEGAERAAGTVALLNGTTKAGLGAEAQGELVERVPELLPAGGTIVNSTTSQHVERSEVLHLAGREAEAYPIGAALGITRVREVSREQLEDVAAPASAVIAVVVGEDFRMR
jgi:hypothetical protein